MWAAIQQRACRNRYCMSPPTIACLLHFPPTPRTDAAMAQQTHNSYTPWHSPAVGLLDTPSSPHRDMGPPRRGASSTAPGWAGAARGAATPAASLLDALEPLLGPGALGQEERRALRQACRAARVAMDGAVRSLDRAQGQGLVPAHHVPRLQRFMARLQKLRELSASASALRLPSPRGAGWSSGGWGGGVLEWLGMAAPSAGKVAWAAYRGTSPAVGTGWRAHHGHAGAGHGD